jgi:hypothetical protein
MEASRSNGDRTEILNLMKQRGQRYLEEFEAFLSEREDLLQLAGMPLAPVMQLAKQWVDEFVSETLGRSRSAPVLPDDLVASLPESVRVFYAPS